MTGAATRRLTGTRLLLFGSLAGLVIVIVWITYFLINFDLNDYRQEAETQLTALFNEPVKIGRIRYSLHNTNLALHLSDLQVGESASPLRLNAADIVLNLQWRGLLNRNIKFTKITLLQPVVVARFGNTEPVADDSRHNRPAPVRIDRKLLAAISIQSLEIRDGTVRITPGGAHHTAQPIEMSAVAGELSAIGLDRITHLTLQGQLQLPGEATANAWQLEGDSSLQVDEKGEFAPDIDLGLNISGLDFNPVWGLLTGQASHHPVAGKGDLKLHLAGLPAKSMEFRIALTSGGIALSPGAAYAQPLVFKSVAASGRLQTQGGHPGIENLELKIDDSRLHGQLEWTPPGQPFALTATLFDSSLPTARIKGWLPNQPGSPWAMVRRNLLDRGMIRLQRAELRLARNGTSDLAWRVVGIRGEGRKIAWKLSDTHLAEIEILPFEFGGHRWQVHGSRGQIGSLRLTLDGQGDYQLGDLKLVSVDFSGAFQPDKLLEEWQLPSHATVASGQVEVKGHLEGSLAKINLDLQADLSQFRISHPSGLNFTSEVGDKLALHATLTPSKVSLDHGSFKWSMAKGHLTGSMMLDDPDSLTVDALLSIDDLRRLAETLPLLAKLQLHGQADLSVHQQGLPRTSPPVLTLTLRDAGLRATPYIADIEQINGRIHLTTTGLQANNLHVHLGQSLLTVQAEIADFSDPHLVLDVQGPAVRASDLVFNSDQAMVRDIRGHLEIDRLGLSFAPVDVRLDGGTLASVRGTVSFHPPYAVNLDITSKFANIAEVIGLWTDHAESEAPPVTQLPPHEPAAAAEAEPRAKRATVTINARVERGDLYGMRFHDASGVIVPSHERLTIHPLDFSVGEGFCNAQVISDFSETAPTLLRISGHAEDVDALEVYQELLNQKNIVRGKLRGDFYLIGETGANYLPSSYGNFSIQIHDGVLHEFQFLSKVFSLLNVSQIFALQLPDMDTEGMPFTTLSANLHLDQGILKSDDLKIRSEAMNQFYTGQLNLINKKLDLVLAIHPLGTVDKIVSHIPVAGWLLTGDDGALLSAHFRIKGTTDDVTVEALPLSTLTEPTLGLLKRGLQLPFKLFEDPQILWGGKSGKD